ncbi:MAG: complex I NDUFA9 subunit family protein, partial [Pseudomonadota bacterium]
MADQLYTVIGGSGFLGRYIVQRLAAAGHRVRVAVRNPEKGLFLKPLGSVGQIMPVAASVLNDASLERALDGADGAVNLVGILFESGKQKFDAVQEEGAARCAQIAAAAGVDRFVQMSAIGADAGSDVGYARTKGRGEDAVLEALPNATVLRPSIVFGPEDGFLNRFGDLAAKAPFMPLICGQTRFQPVYVGDVATAVCQALTQDDFQGKTYELGGPKTYSFKEVLSFILSETMRRRPF